MKIIHYSRDGYQGNLTYKSVCGKIVKTHQETEGSIIHPNELVNCEHCLATKAYQIDARELETPAGIKRRIYIDSDIVQADEFTSAQRAAYDFAEDLGLKCVERVFSEVLEFARRDMEKTWKAVKAADEIWAMSSLMPLHNGYAGAPVIFNFMCKKALEENITGKSIFLLTDFSNIYWNMIEIPLMKKVFKKNYLYAYNDNGYDLVKFDVTKVKK